MATKKFLDQTGVSILWDRINQEFAEKEALTALQEKVDNLEAAGGYDDSELRGLISDNAEAIETLNGTGEGSVDKKVADEIAKIVNENANGSIDTLNEIAAWIVNDTTGAADMANDIKALQDQLVGIDSTVVAKIAAEIEVALKVDGVDKYALASDLSALADRVKAVEEAGFQNAEQVSSAIDAKIAALKLAESYDAKGAAATAETNAKAHADDLNSAMDVRVQALEGIDHTKFETAGAAATALSDAKAYTDTEIAKIQSLNTAEIEAAIAAASQA